MTHSLEQNPAQALRAGGLETGDTFLCLLRPDWGQDDHRDRQVSHTQRGKVGQCVRAPSSAFHLGFPRFSPTSAHQRIEAMDTCPNH